MAYRRFDYGKTIRALEECIETKRHIHHTFVNDWMNVAMQKDPEQRVVLGAVMINADQQSVF